MNNNDNETLLSKLIAGATHLIKPKVQTRMKCPNCGEWKMQGDSSPCGSHPVLPDPDNDTFLIRIGFVNPKPALPGPPKVERLGRSPDTRPVNEKFVDTTKPDPIKHKPTDDEQPEDIWADVRGTGGYKRKGAIEAEWSMTSKELNKAQDRAEGIADEEPETPDTPRYGL